MLANSALIANGEIEEDAALIAKIKSCDHLIAVDGGLNHCRRFGLVPSMIIGDFDSADPDALRHFENVPQKAFPKDKDKTDLELAVEYAFSLEARTVVIFGGLGGRIDHTLANINLLCLYPGKLYLESSKEFLFVIDRQVSLKCTIGQTISLIPLNGPVSGIQTKGLKWKLENGVLDKHFMGISNLCLSANIHISVEKGDLLCCVNKSGY